MLECLIEGAIALPNIVDIDVCTNVLVFMSQLRDTKDDGFAP